MLKILKELLEDFKTYEGLYYETYVEKNDKRIIAIETVIEIIEKLRNNKNEEN